VTVCIAAIANSGRAIVLASDRMISTEQFSADSAIYKIRGIHHDWAALCSASSTDHIYPILRETRTVLSKDKAPKSRQDVARALICAYQARHLTVQNDKVLSPYGMDRKAFFRKGPRGLGDSFFQRVALKLEQVNLGCRFLVAGYDRTFAPHVFLVQHPGEEVDRTYPGFWATGSGATSALSVLFFYSPTITDSLERVLYCVCAAKFMAETAPGVGKDTSVVILETFIDEAKFKAENPDACISLRVRELPLPAVNDLRKLWKRGMLRIPGNITDKVAAVLRGTEPASLGPVVGT